MKRLEDVEVLGVTATRQNLLRLVRNEKGVLITHDGKAAAVLLPYEEYLDLAAFRDSAGSPGFEEMIRRHDDFQQPKERRNTVRREEDVFFSLFKLRQTKDGTVKVIRDAVKKEIAETVSEDVRSVVREEIQRFAGKELRKEKIKRKQAE